VEIFIRNALLLSKQPAVHFIKMSVEGGGKLAFLNQWFRGDTAEKGALAGYNPFAIIGFDNFGAPFDQLRRTMNKTRMNRYANTEAGRKMFPDSCTGNNVADCPVDAEKQDGYHHDPIDMGYPVDADPMYRHAGEEKGLHRLFVNWHPAPLAHEVIGNQIAYYHLGLMQQALTKLAAASGTPSALAALLSEYEASAAKTPLPPAATCKDEVCTYLGDAKPQCAYSFVPHAEGSPTVADWADTLTMAALPKRVRPWQEADVSGGSSSSCPDAQRARATGICRNWTALSAISVTNNDRARELANCIEGMRYCSYSDRSRGMQGFADSGPLVLKFPPNSMYRCKIWIGEPQYGWSKPKDKASRIYAQQLTPFGTINNCCLQLSALGSSPQGELEARARDQGERQNLQRNARLQF
jgi:hypothetical protein